MNLNLNHATALVTASTGGIGLAIAETLAREAAQVIINGRSEATVIKAIEKISANVPAAKLLPLVADNGTAAGCSATIAAYPHIDILVNNLGIYEASDFFATTDEAWQHFFEVNIMSGVRLSRHYLKDMLAHREGRIIFIASEAAISPAPEMAHYSATKTMQLSISRSLAELTRGTKVTVNTVMPGSTLTENVQKFIANIFPNTDREAAERKFIAENRSTSLIERFIQPQEVADTVAFIASKNASAINGAAIRVDGGLVRNII